MFMLMFVILFALNAFIDIYYYDFWTFNTLKYYTVHCIVGYTE